MTAVSFAKTTFVESHGDRSLAYEGGRLIHHLLGHDLTAGKLKKKKPQERTLLPAADELYVGWIPQPANRALCPTITRFIALAGFTLSSDSRRVGNFRELRKCNGNLQFEFLGIFVRARR